jgi:protein-disulfide isomerase
MNRTLALMAVIIGLAGYFWYDSTSDNSFDDAGSITLLGAAHAQEVEAEIDISTVVDMTIGNLDADVTVIEYASFTCPHCGNFHMGDFKELKKDYIDTGKIKFVYREVYFDRFGLWASAIARCAGPEKFFGITDLLYSSQSEWARAGGGDPAAIVEALRKIGLLAGLSSDNVEACLQDGDNLRTLGAWYQENVERDGVQSTPSFVIDGRTYKNIDYDEMKRLIDEAYI